MPFRRRRTANHDRREHRLQYVTRLRARGMGLGEIAKALSLLDPPIVSPNTGRPLSTMQISRDLACLNERWRKTAVAEFEDRQLFLLAECREARRFAWAKGDLRNVYRGLEIEIRLLGIKGPLPKRPEPDDGSLDHLSDAELEVLAKVGGFFERTVDSGYSEIRTDDAPSLRTCRPCKNCGAIDSGNAD